MRVFRESRFHARCERCRLPFDPGRGGVCPSCGRLLCDAHLYGSFVRRWQGYLGGHPACVECRRGSPGDAGTEVGRRDD